MAAPTCSAYPDKQMETRQWQGHRPPTVSVEHDLLDTQTPDDGRAPCNAAALASDTPLSSIKAALLIATETPMIATLPIRIKGGRVSDLKEHAFCVQDAAQHLWKQDVHVSVQEALASPASGTSAGSSLFLTGRLMELDLNHERDAARSKAPLDVQPVDPLALTIREALTAMAEGVYTSVDLVEMFLGQSHEVLYYITRLTCPTSPYRPHRPPKRPAARGDLRLSRVHRTSYRESKGRTEERGRDAWAASRHSHHGQGQCRDR